MTAKPTAAPARRTDAIDAEIGKLDTKIRELSIERRRLIGDIKSDPEQIGKVNAHIQALRDQVEGQREIRREAEAMDKRDRFLRERERIRALSESTLQLLGSREAAARKIDAAMRQIGEALEEIARTNREAWNSFTEVAKEIATNKRTYENAVWANQGRVLTCAHSSDALAYGLKNAGVGSVGVSCDLLYPVTTYRDGRGQSLEESMHEANNKVERHLAILFRDAGEKAAAASQQAAAIDEDATEQQPAQVTDYSRPPTQ